MTASSTDQRRLGCTDLLVHPLCLGGNVFGWTADENESFAVLDAYRDAGGNFVDTSDAYSARGPGLDGSDSERTIGRWLVRSGRRDALVLATKIGAFGGLSRKNIFARVDASLRRLHTDYVDLLYAHLDDPNTPLEETLAAFDEVVRAGRARYIAASNFTPTRLSAAAEVSRRGGFARYVVIQMHYNLLERTQLRIDRLGIAATNPCSVRSVTVRVSPASPTGCSRRAPSPANTAPMVAAPPAEISAFGPTSTVLTSISTNEG
jgi:aryl-alcohol dehydrogenase-like predicted oxidoreductase